MTHDELRGFLADRIVIFEGGMGTTLQEVAARRARPRTHQRRAPGRAARRSSRLRVRGRRHLHEHLRWDVHQARRGRVVRQGRGIQRRRGEAGSRSGRRRHARRGRHGANWQAGRAAGRPRFLGGVRRVPRSGRGPRRVRSRLPPDRDHVGPQGGEGRSSCVPRGDGASRRDNDDVRRDVRHPDRHGRRDGRQRAHFDGRVRSRRQLLDRTRTHGRGRRKDGAGDVGADTGPAERRSPRTGGRPDGLPSRGRRVRGLRRQVRDGRRVHAGRLLRHDSVAHRGSEGQDRRCETSRARRPAGAQAIEPHAHGRDRKEPPVRRRGGEDQPDEPGGPHRRSARGGDRADPERRAGSVRRRRARARRQHRRPGRRRGGRDAARGAGARELRSRRRCP